MTGFLVYLGIFGSAVLASISFGLYMHSFPFGFGVFFVLMLIITLTSVVAQSIEKAWKD